MVTVQFSFTLRAWTVNTKYLTLYHTVSKLYIYFTYIRAAAAAAAVAYPLLVVDTLHLALGLTSHPATLHCRPHRRQDVRQHKPHVCKRGENGRLHTHYLFITHTIYLSSYIQKFLQKHPYFSPSTFHVHIWHLFNPPCTDSNRHNIKISEYGGVLSYTSQWMYI